MSPAAPPAATGTEPAPRGDLLLALAVLGVVALLLLPLPPFALDGLLAISIGAVSYTHLTLPTILLV